MSDTPETDGEAITPSGFEADEVPADFARKLERERDEARTTIEDAKRALNAIGYEGILLAALRVKEERDEALIDRANRDIATMTTNHYERILRERDEAILLLKLCAEYALTTHQDQVEEFLKKIK